MPSGPSTGLEHFVRFWLPPASREEVLGDLYEKYTGPLQYLFLAMGVIPCVIASRIRRTTDGLILFTEALLIYGSFLAAAWYTDKTLVTGPWGLLRVAVPTAFNVGALIVERAWDYKLWLQPAVAVINVDFFSFSGFLASTMLVFAVEILFRPDADVTQRAEGPALLMENRTVPSSLYGSVTKRLLGGAALIALAVLVVTNIAPGIVNITVLLGLAGLVLWGLVRRTRRKE